MATPYCFDYEVLAVVKSRIPVFLWSDNVSLAGWFSDFSNKRVNFILKDKVYHEGSSFETSDSFNVGSSQRQNLQANPTQQYRASVHKATPANEQNCSYPISKQKYPNTNHNTSPVSHSSTPAVH